MAHREWQGGRRYQEDDSGVLEVEGIDAGDPPALLMVLADGMGGEAGGATASDTVVRTFVRQFENSAGSIHTRLRECLARATASLAEQEENDPRLEGMGSTVVAALYDGRRVSWLSVGDSPMWLFADGRLERLNDDHSMVPVLEALVRDGEMTREEALGDRRRNMLRSAVTGTPADLVDCAERSCRLRPGDYLLIASDGLETLSEEEIEQRLHRAGGGAEDAADALLSAVKSAAGPNQDNVTFLLLSGESAADERAPRRTGPADAAGEPETAARSGRRLAGFAAVLMVGLLVGILAGTLGSDWLAGSTPGDSQVEECDTRFPPGSLTEDNGKTAIECYRKVQDSHPENARAREGLRRAFGKYEEWADAALQDKDRGRAGAYLKTLKELSPEARAVEKIDRGIADLRRLAASARKAASEAKKLTTEAKRLTAEAKKLTADAKKQRGRAKKLATEAKKLVAPAAAAGKDAAEARTAAKKASEDAQKASEDARKLRGEVQTSTDPGDETENKAKAAENKAGATKKKAEAAKKKAEAAEKKAETAKKKAKAADEEAKAADKKAETAEKKAETADEEAKAASRKARKARERAAAAKKRAG